MTRIISFRESLLTTYSRYIGFSPTREAGFTSLINTPRGWPNFRLLRPRVGESTRDYPAPEGGSARGRPREAADIQHSRECEECGSETYQFERCHVCGDVPWKEGSA